MCSSMLGEREMQRLRLAEAARTIDFDARLAREALYQFDEQQRLLDQAEIASTKRKLRDLQAQPSPASQETKRQKLLVQGKREQQLGAFGFTSNREATPELIFHCSHGCERGFLTLRARAAHHARHHKQSVSNFSKLEVKTFEEQPGDDKLVTPAIQATEVQLGHCLYSQI